MLTVGQRINGFEVLSILSKGRRAIVACGCGGTHVVGTEALQNGIACAAAPLSRQMREAFRAEAVQQERRRAHPITRKPMPGGVPDHPNMPP
jgi:hypothetical protein